MDNSSTPPGPPADQQQQEPIFLVTTVMMMRLSPAQADRMARRRRRNNDDPRLDRFGRRLRRMTDFSYPYMPPSSCLDPPDFPEPAVVIIPCSLQGEAAATDYAVHYVYPPLPAANCHTAATEQQQVVPLQDGATTVVCLANILSSSSQRRLLEDDDFYDRFVEDFEAQACWFGELVKIVVPRPPNGNPAGVVGKVFLKFACLDAANVCKIRMDRSCWRRSDDDKQIVARFYPEDKFAAGDYGRDN
uniref:Uncharacterized protein n=1 Tax=Avena sativa TaxID=4498 RepID=A0ACD6AQ92_AVESA